MMMQILRLTFLVLALCTGSVAGAAQVDAWLDRTQIAEGDTVQLTLEAQGQVDGQPDTGPLQQDFDILGTSTGSRISIVNGRTDARTSWTLTLSPKHAGKLRIPALQVGGAASPELTLVVSNAPAPAADSGADIFIETELAPRRPYVQQQVLYTVRLLHAVPVSGGQLSEPKPANTLVQQLGEDRDYTTTRGGRRYQVTERRYALFPQGSGRLELAAPVFDGEVPVAGGRSTSPLQRFFGNDPFFGRGLFDDLMTSGRRTRIRGEAQSLEVLPRPAAARSAHWLPAQALALNGAWQPEASDVPAGEPVTLELDITARGLTGGQLPNLAPASVDGFDVYPDQAQRTTESDANGVTGHLRQKIAFIPRRAGKLSLPEIRLDWWDTQAGRERVDTLPGRVLQVTPGAGRAAQAPAVVPPSLPAHADSVSPAEITAAPEAVLPAAETRQQSSGSSVVWIWTSALLGALWVFTLLVWWWRSRAPRAGAHQAPPERTAPVARAGRARKQFQGACASGDAAAARDALLDWAAAHWTDDPPRGLQALAQRLDDSGAREALTGLERALYKGGDWNGQPLAAHLQQLPQHGRVRHRREHGLAPLYPGSGRSYG